MQCAEQHIVQCSNFTTEQCAQCNLQSNVHNVQRSFCSAEQCAEECVQISLYSMCRSVRSEECVPMQCNLQLSSQLVNLLLLDWTRSSQLRNIANLSPLKICFPMFVFGRNFNVFTCSSTTVLLPNTHISCCNYKLMWRQFWRGTPSWSFVFLALLRTERYYRVQSVKLSRVWQSQNLIALWTCIDCILDLHWYSLDDFQVYSWADHLW